SVGPEDLALRLLGEVRGDRDRVPGGERELPAARRTAPRDLDDQPVEVAQAELVAAEAPRLDDPVEARIQELLVDLIRDPRQLLRELLALPQVVPHGPRPFDEG